MRRKIITTSTYHGYPVITGDVMNYDYNLHHLDKNAEFIQDMVNSHNKVVYFRFDLRLPAYRTYSIEEAKEFIRRFMNSYTKRLSRKPQPLDPAYAVKMERKKSNNPHFHCFILVNGNIVRDHIPLIKIAEDLLYFQLGLPADVNHGLIDYCNGFNNGGCIIRYSSKFEEQFNACHKQMSYLAKQDPYDMISSKIRKISYSRSKSSGCRSSRY